MLSYLTPRRPFLEWLSKGLVPWLMSTHLWLWLPPGAPLLLTEHLISFLFLGSLHLRNMSRSTLMGMLLLTLLGLASSSMIGVFDCWLLVGITFIHLRFPLWSSEEPGQAYYMLWECFELSILCLKETATIITWIQVAMKSPLSILFFVM